jgi:probable HAF family extracellular repeat protein
MNIRRLFLLAVVVGALGLAPAQAARAASVPHYRLTIFGRDFPTLADACPGAGLDNFIGWTYATSINNNGVVAGTWQFLCDPSFTSFVRQPDGSLQFELLPRTGFDDGVNGINSAGDLAGFDTIEVGVSGASHPAARLGGIALDLGNLGWPAPAPCTPTVCVPDIEASTAYGIDDRGSIVGTAGTSELRYHAFLWREGRMRDLGVLPGYANSAATATNNGRTVGFAFPQNGCLSQDQHLLDPEGCIGARAVNFEATGARPLPTLGGNTSFADDINATSTIVGGSTTFGDAAMHAFSYSNGVTKDLGPGIARAINKAGSSAPAGSTPTGKSSTSTSFSSTQFQASPSSTRATSTIADKSSVGETSAER